jgi:hypothetical protein
MFKTFRFDVWIKISPLSPVCGGEGRVRGG